MKDKILNKVELQEQHERDGDELAKRIREARFLTRPECLKLVAEVLVYVTPPYIGQAIDSFKVDTLQERNGRPTTVDVASVACDLRVASKLLGETGLAMTDLIVRLRDELSEDTDPVCQWVHRPNRNFGDFWETDCRATLQLDPIENKMNYCHLCGRQLRV